MTGRRMGFPGQATGIECLTRAERSGGGESRAALAGHPIRQGVGIPLTHGLQAGLWHDDRAIMGGGQRGIAAAVIRMQMGVDDARQSGLLPDGGPGQRLLDEPAGQRHMLVIPGIDEGGAAVLVMHEHMIGRQPVALDETDACGQGHGSTQRRERSGVRLSYSRAMSAKAAASSGVPA